MLDTSTDKWHVCNLITPVLAAGTNGKSTTIISLVNPFSTNFQLISFESAVLRDLIQRF